MPVWEAGGRKQCLSTCYLGLGVCVATWQGYWVWHLREQLGTLNVSYRLGQSRKREISPAHDNQQCPQIETLFKCLGLTSQEAIRGGGKAPNQGGLKWSPLGSQVQATVVLHIAPITTCHLLGCLFTAWIFPPESKLRESWGQAYFSSPRNPQSLEKHPQGT